MKIRRQYYSTSEVATILGCSAQTVRIWCQDGTIPDAIKPGKRWRIPVTSEIFDSSPKHHDIPDSPFTPDMTVAEFNAAYDRLKGVTA